MSPPVSELRPQGMMIDPYGRSIRYLRISVTDRCNLRCFYCMPDGLEEDEKYLREEILSWEEMERLARIFVGLGVEKIRVTGGEPLYRKGVVDFVGRIGKLAGLREIGMTTNGLALAAQAKRLKENGLSRINVSLDTLDRDRFEVITKYDGWEQVMAGIRAAIDADLSPVKINVVVMKGMNDDEIVKFADWAYREPVVVRFIEYMPFDAGIPGQKDHYLPSSEVIARILAKYDLELVEGSAADGPSVHYRMKGGAGELGFISPIDTGFCGTCNRVRLTAIGKLRLCLFSDDGIDLREPLRTGESDARIAARIQDSMAIKPEKHHLQEGIPYEGLAMSQVGG